MSKNIALPTGSLQYALCSVTESFVFPVKVFEPLVEVRIIVTNGTRVALEMHNVDGVC